MTGLPKNVRRINRHVDEKKLLNNSLLCVEPVAGAEWSVEVTGKLIFILCSIN